MNKPLILKDSFWGDLANALLLRPPYRENKAIHIVPEVDPPVTMAEDPDMAPGLWVWRCADCDAGSTGDSQDMRVESMSHCLFTGHAVMGNIIE